MNIGTAILAVSIVWLGTELLLVRFRRSKFAEKRRDNFTIWILWFAITVAVVGGIYFGSHSFGSLGKFSLVSRVVGIALVITGVVFRWIAILTLKQHFTVDVAIMEKHELVTHGLYRYLRHPAYAGTLLSFLGLGCAFANWVSIFLVVTLIPLAFLRRIHVEEKVLLEQFGSDYAAYCGTSKRLIPFLY